MNTGLPRHFTVMAWPTAIGFTFTSTWLSASVSAAGLRLLMKGHAVAIAPTAAIAPDATIRKSRRVGSLWAPAGMLEEAICVFAPLGRRNRLKSHALFKASSVAASVLMRYWPNVKSSAASEL